METVNSSQGPASTFVRSAVQDMSRLAEITRLLWKHGFGDAAPLLGLPGGVGGAPPSEEERSAMEAPSRDPFIRARRFRLLLEDLGPTAIKIGQVLSTRPDILPAPFIAELSYLRDAAPALPFEAIRAQVEHALGGPLDAHFKSFDPEPLAVASMAQTHLAQLPDGREVVVKVQRPGLEALLRADLDLLRLCVGLIEWLVDGLEIYSASEVIAELDRALFRELDFEHEASNIERMAELLRDYGAELQQAGPTKTKHEGIDDPDSPASASQESSQADAQSPLEEPPFIVPAVYRSHSRATVLTMQRIHGQSVAALVSDSAEAHRVAALIIEAYYVQLARFGFFHADPHPGNLLLTPEGRLAFIDFGLCGSLTGPQRELLVILSIAAITDDPDGVARVLMRMGTPLGRVSLLALKQEISTLRSRHLRQELANIDASALVDDLVNAARRHRIRLPSEYSVLGKAAVTAEGVVRGLAPSFDLQAHMKPFGKRMAADLYNKEWLLRSGTTHLLSLGHLLRDLPDQVSQTLMDLEQGGLQVHMTNPGIEHVDLELKHQTTRQTFALAGAASLIAAPLWMANEPIMLFGVLPVFTLAALGFGTTMIGASLLGHFRQSGRAPIRREHLERLGRRFSGREH